MVIVDFWVMVYDLDMLSFIIFSFFALTFTLYPSPVFAADCDPKTFGECPPAGLEQIEKTFSKFISISVGIAFVATLVMAVMAGFKYLTSGGEPKAVSAAHQTLTWALLGIFMLAVAWVVLQLINAFTGVEVTAFDVKGLCGGSPNFPFCSPSPVPKP